MIKVNIEKCTPEGPIIELGTLSGIELAAKCNLDEHGVATVFYDRFGVLRKTLFPIAFDFMDIYRDETYRVYIKNGSVRAKMVKNSN